jgi:F0F1-type ATP synthase membrane subunit b/b'
MNVKSAPPEETVEGQSGEEPEEAPFTEPQSVEDQGIGARVTAVFTAAEKAGQHIVSLARSEAEDILREARAEAEAYKQQRKLEADQDVERIFAEARRKADGIEEDARVRARQVEDDARVRKERLREEARLVEERIDWVKEGLREVSDRIQQVYLAGEPLPLAPDTDS